MIELLAAQPSGQRSAVTAALAGPEIHMAMMLHLDFADGALNLSNRSLPFSDLQHGRDFMPGAGLLVGLPSQIDGGDDNLAPLREYHLGLPNDLVDMSEWAARLVEMCQDKANYRERAAELSLQLFNRDTGAVVGWPVVFDSGIMDTMKVSFQLGGAVVSLSSEGLLARKGVPVYGMQTYRDQKRRFIDDEGFQFVTESGRLITWTDW